MLDYRAHTFLEVYRQRSYTRAADALHISIAGVVCYLLADIALIVEAFAASRVERATIVVEPAAA